MITDAFSDQLQGRVPYRVKVMPEGRLQFTWIYTGQKSFEEPFFDETVARCLSLPENSNGNMPVTDAQVVLQRARAIRSLPLAGIIHHISRCGSTLLAQLLNEDKRLTVLSEVPLLDDLLMMQYRTEEPEGCSIRELFIAVVRLMTQRSDDKAYAFIKADSWHIHFHDLLRSWYPDVPAFLLFREPGEVIRSHQRQPGMHAVPGLMPSALFGLTQEEAVQMTLPAYLDRVLISYFLKYADMLKTDSGVTALSYHAGAMEMFLAVLRTCNITISEHTLTAIEARAGFHSKHPGQKFSGDGMEKVSCSDELRVRYQQLESNNIETAQS